MDKTRKQEFEKAYEDYADSIFRYLMVKTRNRQMAVDLTQDTFIETWDYMNKGKSILAVRPFLYRVAHNLWGKALRIVVRQTSLDSLVDQGWQPVDEENIEEEAALRDDQAKILQKLEALDDAYKEVLLLRYIDDFSVTEIAEMLDETENTISVRIHRARKQLRDIYHAYE